VAVVKVEVIECVASYKGFVVNPEWHASTQERVCYTPSTEDISLQTIVAAENLGRYIPD
jgi:hypothetical protein